MPTKVANPGMQKPVPVELAGKWVAWSSDHSHVVAYSETLPALWKLVEHLHIEDPVFEKVPQADVCFVGIR